MTEIPKLGYLLPEFPGQAHSLYWREILKLEAMGIEAVLFSDRSTDTAAHAWAKGARQRTEYLAQGTMSSLMSLPKLPWRQLKQGSRQCRTYARRVTCGTRRQTTGQIL